MRVLIVEDDPGIAGGLSATLRSRGYVVDAYGTLKCAWAAVSVCAFDLILLDLTLPDGDGIEWLQRLRRHADPASGLRPLPSGNTPVLIMTARDALPERVAGLDAGADDYLVKPFEPEELMARMRAAMRRSGGRRSPVLRHDGIEVDLAGHTVQRDGQAVVLRAKEFNLFVALLQAHGQVLSRQQLEETLYGFDDEIESNALEVYVHHLRRKLGNDVIKTMRGVGYFIPLPHPS
jgi:two-component system, OmpR family, response regulator QseB